MMGGLGNILQASVIKSFIPMIKENLPKLEAQIVNITQSVELEPDEEYAAIVITASEGRVYITTCAFDYNDQLMRQIQSISLPEFIEKLLTSIK